MPTILIMVPKKTESVISEYTESVISEYTDIVFICSYEEQIIYNSIVVKNRDQRPIDSLIIYIPYPIDIIDEIKVINVASHKEETVYTSFTAITLNFSPQVIPANTSRKIELSYRLKHIETKTALGFQVGVSFYNLNFIRDINIYEHDGFSSFLLPIISENIHLITACVSNYTFVNVDSIPEAGKITRREDNNHLVRNAMTKIDYLCPKNVEWSDFLYWGSPQLSNLPETIIPAYSGRAVKAYFDKINFINIRGMKFSFPDIISLIFALISLVIGILGIFFW